MYYYRCVYCPRLRGGMEVYVITLTVEPYDTIDTVKCKIQDKDRTPPDQQRLMHYGKLMGDDRMVCEYDINSGSTIHLILRLLGGMQIFVKTFTGKIITLGVVASETIENVKAKIQDEEGIPLEQ